MTAVQRPDVCGSKAPNRLASRASASGLRPICGIFASDWPVIRSIVGLAGQYATVDELLTGRENLELAGLDEPTTGLDPRTRNELWQLIGEPVPRAAPPQVP
jgi:hypothetical protein